MPKFIVVIYFNRPTQCWEKFVTSIMSHISRVISRKGLFIHYRIKIHIGILI